MPATQHVKNPPALTAVHRAVVNAMAEHGPLRVPRTVVARLAGTDRQFLRRTWPDRDKLHLAALTGELSRLLDIAAARADISDAPPAACLSIRQIVRAAKLVREHSVTAATARTAPDLLRAACHDIRTPLHGTALGWIMQRPLAHQARTAEGDFGALAHLMFAVALPFSLAPGDATRQTVDTRLSRLLHTCVTSTADCTGCACQGLN